MYGVILDQWGTAPMESYCPSCGRSGVKVGLDCVLIETAPVVRRHACGVGGCSTTTNENEE